MWKTPGETQITERNACISSSCILFWEFGGATKRKRYSLTGRCDSGSAGGFLRRLVVIALMLAALVPLPARAGAGEAVRADFAGAFTDLRPAMKLARSPAASVVLEVPAGKPGRTARMALSATGARKPHDWVFFSLTNPAARPARLVLDLGGASFAGSGLAPLTRGAAPLSWKATPGAEIVPEGGGLFRLRLPAGASATYVFETPGPQLAQALLWHEAAYEAHRLRRLFFAGILTGAALLVSIALLSLYALRQIPALPAAALFSMGAAGFMTTGSGVLEAALAWAGAPAALWRLAAFFEGLMLTGLAVWLPAWLELHRRFRPAGWIFGAIAAGAAGLSIWALFEPMRACPLIRLSFLLLVFVGSVLTGALRRRGRGHPDGGFLMTWALLFAWTLLAGLTAAGVTGQAGGELIAAGLALVVLSMGMTMARAAFSPTSGLRRFFSDAARRALALAGAHQAVWDYDAVSGTLHVGGELDTELGLPAGTLAGGGEPAFAARMHPADLPLYRAAVEGALQPGRGRFSIQFRLRRADGGYRWYLLRAHPMREAAGAGAPTRLVGALVDITNIRRSEERILSDAVRDRVTGLPNRPLLLDRLKRAMNRIAAGGGGLYLIVLDIDRFRNINDAWGFETGDALLARMARRIARLLEPEDTLARLPGDQFAIIVSAEMKPRDIVAFAERLRRWLARPFDLGVREVSMTVCMGVTHLRKGQDMEAEDALKQAEIALFEARKRGNDAIAFFEERMLTGRSQLVSLEQDLRRAVERGEIRVLYQPIVDLASGRLAGFEALARWAHPLHGMLGADSFIGLAEEIGLIGQISRVVLEETARNLGVWQRAFRPETPIFASVNISSVQLLNASLVEEVAALLEREGIEPATLKLELTESLILENPELGRRILERLAALGVGIACDDFGTGYSSLSSLRDLPFSILKVDRAFLEAGEENPRAGIILRSVVEMAHGLGMNVVAEGVETEEQLARLNEMGCDMAQGWLIGPPVRARRIIEALTGVSLDVAERARPGSLRDILRGKKDDGEEDDDAGITLPPPPVAHPPSPLHPPGEAGTPGEAEAASEAKPSGDAEPAEKPGAPDEPEAPGEPEASGEETGDVKPAPDAEEKAQPRTGKEEKDAGEGAQAGKGEKGEKGDGKGAGDDKGAA